MTKQSFGTGSLNSPRPGNPLRRLERLVGHWMIRGRTPGSAVDDIRGHVTIKWVPGGILLQQQSELRSGRLRINSLELVGYDPRTKTFPSYVYTDLAEDPLPYSWTIQKNTVIHAGLGATFAGKLSTDGKTLAGRWRPDKGIRATRGNSYDAIMTRAP